MKQFQALVAAADTEFIDLVCATLNSPELQCKIVATLDDAVTALQQEYFHFCVASNRFDHGAVVELVSRGRALVPNFPVVVIAESPTVQEAVEVLKAGAFDYCSAPVDAKQLRKLANIGLRMASPRQLLATTKEPLLLGLSEPIQQTKAQLMRVAKSALPVIILGAAGTGKSIAANMLHQFSSRYAYPLLQLNCAMLAEEVLAVELFGDDETPGLLHDAQHGSVLLKDIDALPAALQTRLLRFLMADNGVESAPNVRLFCSSRRDFNELLAAGLFNAELYFRLNLLKISMPSLHQHLDDIEVLSHYLLKRCGEEWQLAPPQLTPEALQWLRQWDYRRGNVRELDNMLRRAVAMNDSGAITLEELAQQADTKPSAAEQVVMLNVADIDDLPATLESLEYRAIHSALAACRWNKTAAAAKLGVSFRHLRYRCSKLGIVREDKEE